MKLSFRRPGLAAVLASLALVVAGCQSAGHTPATSAQPSAAGVAAAPITKAAQSAMTPQQALEELRAGNARFVSGHPLVRHPAEDDKTSAAGQYPFAVVLSCLDSRQPIELVTDQGIGDIFRRARRGQRVE